MTVMEPHQLTRSQAVRARMVTYGAIVLLVTCSIAGLEWWPLSEFRLFSSLRTQDQVSWEMTTVSNAGVETTVDLGDLPPSYWGAHHVIPELPAMSTQDQQAAVLAWLQGARVETDGVSSVRFYAVGTQVPTEPSLTPTLVSRTQLLDVPLP